MGTEMTKTLDLITIGRIGLATISIAVGTLAFSGAIAYWQIVVFSVLGVTQSAASRVSSA